jgi:hypothetical protein
VHPKSEKAKGSGREPEKTCAKQGQKSDLQARFTKKVALVEVNPESEFAAQDRGTDSGLCLMLAPRRLVWKTTFTIGASSRSMWLPTGRH